MPILFSTFARASPLSLSKTFACISVPWPSRVKNLAVSLYAKNARASWTAKAGPLVRIARQSIPIMASFWAHDGHCRHRANRPAKHQGAGHRQRAFRPPRQGPAPWAIFIPAGGWRSFRPCPGQRTALMQQPWPRLVAPSWMAMQANAAVKQQSKVIVLFGHQHGNEGRWPLARAPGRSSPERARKAAINSRKASQAFAGIDDDETQFLALRALGESLAQSTSHSKVRFRKRPGFIETAAGSAASTSARKSTPKSSFCRLFAAHAEKLLFLEDVFASVFQRLRRRSCAPKACGFAFAADVRKPATGSACGRLSVAGPSRRLDAARRIENPAQEAVWETASYSSETSSCPWDWSKARV